MLRTARLLTAIAVAAMALPLAAAETKETKDAKATPAPAASTLPTQEQRLEATGKETRNLPNIKKMTPEEKKADKAAKRKPATKEEEEKIKKGYTGG